MSPSKYIGVVLVLALTAWPVVADEPSWQQPAAPEAAQEDEVKETAAVYQGDEAERFLARARVTRIQSVGQGVTAPRRVTLVHDGVTRTAVYKTLHEERPGITQLNSGQVEVNFVDTWRTEIAAYRVDRMIGLGLVPATVERSVRGVPGSLQWWVQVEMPEAQRVRNKILPPDTEMWNRQQLNMELFDNLIYNTDRHLNNILVTKDFELRLIDHSRTFRTFTELKPDHKMTRFSRSLLAAIEALDQQELRKQIGRYVSRSQIDTMLRRRDAILALARQLVAERGEAAVLFP